MEGGSQRRRGAGTLVPFEDSFRTHPELVEPAIGGVVPGAGVRLDRFATDQLRLPAMSVPLE